LHRYFSGEATEQEKIQVESWVDSDPRNREFMQSMKEIWEIEPGDEIEVNARAAWNSFKNRLSDKPGEVTVGGSTRLYGIEELRRPGHSYETRTNRNRRVVALAATAAAVLLLAVVFYQVSPTLMGNVNDTSGETPRGQLISTERGQRTSLRLFDGTRVQLNAESSIRIPPGFGDSTRSVHLQGQAYFDVVRNTDLPFIVYSGNSLTKVLGTKFDVKDYPEDEQVQVAVEEGRVALAAAGSEMGNSTTKMRQITKGQIGLLNRDGRSTVTPTEEIQRYLGWKDGRLIFDATAFGEAIPKLQRWYDIKIEVADASVNSKRITASFKDEPMTEVMNIIALSLDMHYERDGRTFTFISN